MEVDTRRHAKNILKMNPFYILEKCKAYLDEKLNSSKGVMKSRELFLAGSETIRVALGK